MAITTEIKLKLEEDKARLEGEIALLKKSMKDFKSQRKTEWKSFKVQFKDDMYNLEKLIKDFGNHKK